MMSILIRLTVSCMLAANLCALPQGDHLVFPGGNGPGARKHIVFLAGDEEYRSEEAMPMMAQVMSKHGFKCTVLFSVDPDGVVNPDRQASLSHSEALDSANVIVMTFVASRTHVTGLRPTCKGRIRVSKSSWSTAQVGEASTASRLDGVLSKNTC